MSFDNEQCIIIDSEDEGDLDFHPIDNVELSQETEWLFEGTWLLALQAVDARFPSMSIGEPMCCEDTDGDLGIGVRIDCGISALWLRIMTLCSMHWVWSGEEYH